MGRNDGKSPRTREQLVLRADEDSGAFGALGPAEEIDHTALGFEIIKQKAHPLEVLNCFEIVEQVSRAPDDQLTFVGVPARPAGEPGSDDLVGKLVDFPLTSR